MVPDLDTSLQRTLIAPSKLSSIVGLFIISESVLNFLISAIVPDAGLKK